MKTNSGYFSAKFKMSGFLFHVIFDFLLYQMCANKNCTICLHVLACNISFSLHGATKDINHNNNDNFFFAEIDFW